MIIHFYVRYKTEFGQSLQINLIKKEKPDNITLINLHYLNNEYWEGVLLLSSTDEEIDYVYRYVLIENNGTTQLDHWPERNLQIKNSGDALIQIYDDWQNVSIPTAVFKTRAFSKVFVPDSKKITQLVCNMPTHSFEVVAPLFSDHQTLCLVGSGEKLKNWNQDEPVLFLRKNQVWTLELNLKKESFPIEFKLGVYDHQLNQVKYLEEGDNRLIPVPDEKTSLSIFHLFSECKNYGWKGAGVNIQLSALKSANSWGVGDFSDLHLLTDWAFLSGIKLIQLLPINDTTATHSRKDAFPYSAISAFALHPIFLDIKKIAAAGGVVFAPSILKEVEKLNSLPTLDYESVANIKFNSIKQFFEKQKEAIKNDVAYLDFISVNRNWLIPYAAFCYLRDLFKTTDFSLWGEYAVYNENKIALLVSKEKSHYDEIALHYFTQYQLHLQLKEVVGYAHKKNVLIKGDLPIGVCRYSVDTWVNPGLFNMNQQAGAPPDAFSVTGQNWGFPTYNWEAMKQDGYAWWHMRIKQMSQYFDAIRIDHVLGFFRIWRIPIHAIEGIFGVFYPAHSISSSEFIAAGIEWNEQRFCNPYLQNDYLESIFGDQYQWVRAHVLEENHLKEIFNTQQKVADYCKVHAISPMIQKGIFDLLANVILWKDENKSGNYHFRISMQQTNSFKELPAKEQKVLNQLYLKFFYENQNELWYKEAQEKLNVIQQSSDMLICAEDLGMVPDIVEGVLQEREMLSLQVQRMPKKIYERFAHPANAHYLSVVTPSTHDMSTLREWWEEEQALTQLFFNEQLGHKGIAPKSCSPSICLDIVLQHLQSPAMWCVFLLQDLMSIDAIVRRENPSEERINNPANAYHYWNYRMHITLEDLISQSSFSNKIKNIISLTGRG